MKNKIDVLTAENYDLKNTITSKDGEFKSLNEKVSGLNSELEASKGRITELENQVNEITSSKENENVGLKSEISSLSSKIEELTSTNEEITKSLEEKEKIIGDHKTHLEKVETELSALKPVEPTAYTSEDRLMCPNCGAVGKDIKSEEDKSKILGYIGHKPMLGKINVCKKCGEQF